MADLTKMSEEEQMINAYPYIVEIWQNQIGETHRNIKTKEGVIYPPPPADPKTDKEEYSILLTLQEQVNFIAKKLRLI